MSVDTKQESFTGWWSIVSCQIKYGKFQTGMMLFLMYSDMWSNVFLTTLAQNNDTSKKKKKKYTVTDGRCLQTSNKPKSQETWSARTEGKLSGLYHVFHQRKYVGLWGHGSSGRIGQCTSFHRIVLGPASLVLVTVRNPYGRFGLS